MDNDYVDVDVNGEAVEGAVKIICEALEDNQIGDEVGFTALVGLSIVTAVDMGISEDAMVKIIKDFYANELNHRGTSKPNTLLH